jgi:hypothetical protein
MEHKSKLPDLPTLEEMREYAVKLNNELPAIPISNDQMQKFYKEVERRNAARLAFFHTFVDLSDHEWTVNVSHIAYITLID